MASLIDPALRASMLRSGAGQGLLSLGAGLMAHGAGGGPQALQQGIAGIGQAMDPMRLYQAQMIQNQLQEQADARNRRQAWDETVGMIGQPTAGQPMLGGPLVDMPGGGTEPGQTQTAMLGPIDMPPEMIAGGGIPPQLLRALGPERGAAFLAQFYKPQAAPKPTSVVQNAMALGLKQGMPEFDEYVRAATLGNRGTQVNIRNEGNIPPGYRAIRDAQGMIQSLEPIPGSPAEQEIAAGEEAKAAQQAERQRTGDIVTQDIDTVLGQIGEGFPVTGVFSAAAAIPGTKADDVAKSLDTIKANIGFDKLQAMRAASPTGGALGQVSERENVLLQSTFGSLAQSQTEEQFSRNLRRLRETYLDVIHGKGNRPTASAEAGKGVTIDLENRLRDDPSSLSDEELRELAR